MTNRTARLVGVQITQPDSAAARRRFAETFLGMEDCDGFEIAFGNRQYREDRSWFFDLLPPGSRHSLNLMGATMEGAAAGFGFASVDSRTRGAALELAENARDTVEELAQRGVEVMALVIHSAPTIDESSRPAAVSALRESVVELARWDWHGAEIVIEHCDARRPGAPFTKGYLALEEEIQLVQDANSAGLATRVGVAINWGRSVIEGRSVETPLQHVKEAKAAGVLRGLMISGVSDSESVYGPPWADSHPPARPTGEHPVGEHRSLLALDLLAEIVEVTQDAALLFEGVKVSMKDERASFDDRVAVNRAVLDAL